MKTVIIVFVMTVMFFGQSFGQTVSVNMVINDLRCEYLNDPQGIDVIEPRLGWILQSDQRGQRQRSYQILVASAEKKLQQDLGDLWDSGKVVSDQSNQVVYGGKLLTSRQPCYWKVRIWDKNDKVSAWSETAQWTMGLLEPSDWQGQWIGGPWQGDWKQEQSAPLPWLRKTFEISGDVLRARAYVSALGYYELYVNGKKVDDHVLSPAVCDYSQRSWYLTHDVTDYLVQGKNCIALWLGRGWYTRGKPGVIHDGPLVKAQVEVNRGTKQSIIIGTDESWKVHPSCITPIGGVGPSQFGGERYDSRKELADWNSAALDDTGWEAAKVFEPVASLIAAQKIPPNRIQEIIKPVAVQKLDDGSYMVDMGKHFSGWFELQMDGLGLAGRKVSMEYFEQQLEGGELRSYNQRDEYICRGEKRERFGCRFNHHAFRSVKITGLDRPPTLDEACGFLIHTDYESAAQFECSNELFNRIYQTVVWTYRCLSLGGYVVDCPHRERQGYGGDGQASLETALANFDLPAFYTKWNTDWHDVQDPVTGDLGHTAPRPSYFAGGGPAWSGICVSIPWQLYCYYGDKRILQESYPVIQKWLNFLDSKSKDHILEPYGHEEWGFLGDWVPPGRGQSPEDRVDAHSTHFFNNCFHLLDVQLAAKIARILGKQNDATRYEKKAEILKPAIHQRFFRTTERTYANGEQTYLAFPLLIGLVPQPLRDEIMTNLEQDILVEKKGHLNTGMLGTYYMLELFMRENRNDLTYEFTNKKTFPSWGFMLEQGATTIWEEWDGYHSQIHNCFLSIGAWFIQALGGIQLDETTPGFKHFYIKPALVGNLSYVNSQYRSIYGKIVSNWRIEANKLYLEITVPVNTTATVYVPTQSPGDVKESDQAIGQSDGLKFIRMEENTAVYLLDSGHYHLSAAIE